MANPDVEAHQSNTTSDVWKWVAAVEATMLTALLLAAIPALLWALRTPTHAELTFVRDRQDAVLQRFSADEQRLTNFEVEHSRLLIQLSEIEALLRGARR